MRVSLQVAGVSLALAFSVISFSPDRRRRTQGRSRGCNRSVGAGIRRG